MIRRNRHPADELADVRSKVKTLQLREAELRAQLLATDDHVGTEWRADVRRVEQERLDAKAAIAHFGRAALKGFLKTIAYEMVVLRKRGRPG